MSSLDARAWRTIWVVVLAPFMTAMDSTVVNVSLSAITLDLHSTVEASQWIITGYLLALALMLPINGWLVDRMGAKKLYLVCFALFTLTSALCGAATTMSALIAARVAQGIAGGLLAPLTQLMMVRVAGRQMAKVLGVAAVPVLIAPLIGPVLAGLILKNLTWSWLFYINLPVGAIAIVLAMMFIPHDETLIVKRPFDFLGFAMLSPALVSLLYGFESASHGSLFGLGLLVGGVGLLVAFLFYAKTVGASALIDIELFRSRAFSIAATTQFLSNGIIYAGQFLIPIYFVNGAHLTAIETGWILAPMGIGMLCIFPFVGALVDRFGIRRVASTGVLLNFAGTLPFLVMASSRFSWGLAIAGLFLRGVGQGATGVPSMTAAYASVSRERLSYATTAINIVQRLGGPVMTTAMAIVLSLSFRSYSVAFLSLIVLQLFILVTTSKLPAKLEGVS